MPIVLLSDFGLQDPYVGLMKGVITRISPFAQIIDLTHQCPPFNIESASFLLSTSYPYFPKESIFVAVVDPGVGSMRKPLLVQTKDYYFIAPDNGLLDLSLQTQSPQQIIEIQHRSFFNKSVSMKDSVFEMSSTFHGRDLFAPAAAYLYEHLEELRSNLSVFGSSLSGYQTLQTKKPEIKDNIMVGKIIWIDHFGNLISNISKSFFMSHAMPSECEFMLGEEVISTFVHYYAQAAVGQKIALFGSAHYLEIALVSGNAAQYFNAKIGDELRVKLCSHNRI